MPVQYNKFQEIFYDSEFKNYQIIDYDYYFYKNINSLDERLENAYKNNKPILLDKTSEHVHNQKNLEDLQQILLHHKILDRCVVIDNTYDHYWFDKFGIKHIYGPWYILNYIINIKSNQIRKIPNYYPNPEKTFLCLNNWHKPHRQKTIELLIENELIDKTDWSYRTNINSKVFQTPKYLDQANTGPSFLEFNQNANLEELYSRALITIVTETDFEQQHILHATEKSLLAIFYGTFPLIVGVPGTINLLRSWHIDVYDDIIDHQYDKCLDSDQRFMLLLKNFKQWHDEKNLSNFKNLIATRSMRNQLLLTDRNYWIEQCKNSLTNKNF